ncbi:MAG: hypothetical protein GZ085_14480 [Sulfuriferula multivorans]|uniref:Uncharacterized protein n=1 Tax=Sulfuriferula multivorans TaxID=1559896 RepID=A0A7C9TBP9_9PROT|nr:hypothetical protein [Sulfuriferula multivorans]
MHQIVAKTLGGLSVQYYLRQFFFGFCLLTASYFILKNNPQPIPVGMAIFLCVNTLLYPYSRFVYERLIHFIVGDNLFIVNALWLLAIKLLTMLVCWVMAIFIAPIGLVYLYLHHSMKK